MRQSTQLGLNLMLFWVTSFKTSITVISFTDVVITLNMILLQKVWEKWNLKINLFGSRKMLKMYAADLLKVHEMRIMKKIIHVFKICIKMRFSRYIGKNSLTFNSIFFHENLQHKPDSLRGKMYVLFLLEHKKQNLFVPLLTFNLNLFKSSPVWFSRIPSYDPCNLRLSYILLQHDL